MNKALLKTGCILASALMLCSAAAHARDDGYDKLAKELSAAATKLAQPKAAIIPFSYVDKRKSEAGVVISERLTTRMVKLGKCTIIERQLLENVLQELHLENTGAVDAETAKQLGKVLGVDAVITGTLIDIEDDMTEINARVIKTETAEVITTASADVKKSWADTVVVVPQPSAAVPAPDTTAAPAAAVQQQATPAAPVRAHPWAKLDTYLDIFGGSMSSGNMKLTFSNTSAVIRESDLSLDLNGSGGIDTGTAYRKVAFADADAASQSMPIGLRVVGFGKHWGGAFELSYAAQSLKKQNTTVQYNGGAAIPFEFYVEDYISVKSLTLLSGDILYRFSRSFIQPYVGLGMGMSLNIVESDGIAAYSDGIYQKPMSEVALGFVFRLPIGVRIEVARDLHAFVEYRPGYNTVWFNRGVNNESDTIVLSPTYFLCGLGFKM